MSRPGDEPVVLAAGRPSTPGDRRTHEEFPSVTAAATVLPVEDVSPSVSLMERIARLFSEPASENRTASPTGAGGPEAGGGRSADGGGAGASDADTTDAVAVVVQAPPAGVRRFELAVRADAPVVGVDPGLLTALFETFDEGPGVVRARAVDVDGHGRTVEGAAPLFVVRFESPVDPETVALDGSLDGHDETPVPWSRVRLTPVDRSDD